jgi:hypothetical protein
LGHSNYQVLDKPYRWFNYFSIKKLEAGDIYLYYCQAGENIRRLQFQYLKKTDSNKIIFYCDWGGKNLDPNNKGEGYYTLKYLKENIKDVDVVVFGGDEQYDLDFSKIYSSYNIKPETLSIEKGVRNLIAELPTSNDNPAPIRKLHVTNEYLGSFANDWSIDKDPISSSIAIMVDLNLSRQS